MTVKKKTILTILLLINIRIMFFSWFGVERGVMDIKGIVVLFNPITMLCIILCTLGIWCPFKKANNWICLLSMLGIIGVEIYTFINWHNITNYFSSTGTADLRHHLTKGKVNLTFSFNTAYPEFYIAFVISLSILAIYIFMDNKKYS